MASQKVGAAAPPATAAAAAAAHPPPKQMLWATDKPALGAHLALLALSLAPLVINVNTNFNIVATAALAVYAGCWRSVKPAPPTETMTKRDALRFPLVGSCVLLGLFLLFKVLPKELVNALLTAYLGLVAVIVLTSALVPYAQDLFPEHLRHREIALPKFKIPYLLDNTEGDMRPSVPELVCGAAALGFCTWYYTRRHWLANNTLGLAFSLEGIEQLSLGSTHIGAILLVGLFFYDIFWVFCTPVMVSVAKNFDAPIKLLFPRQGLLDNGKRPFAMLGLGDIVIPGIFVALMLRYDVSRNFQSKYFQSAFGGYVLGLATTIFVMNYFQAAQPALLYIVPSVLGCVALHAAVKREFRHVWAYSEEVAPPAAEGEGDGEGEKHADGAAGEAGDKAGAGAAGEAAGGPVEGKKEK